MSQEVRLHDVTISGDVDSRAVLAAIERAVAAATQTGRPTTQVVQRAVAAQSPRAGSHETAATPQVEVAPATLWRCGGRDCGAGECEHDENKLHRHASGPGPDYAPGIVHEVLRTSGAPLPTGVRGTMEQHLGHDFADVRIHTDAAAGRSATAVNALAYTVGRHVVFGAGHYDPASASGQRLLRHELSHAADAGPGAAPPSGSLRVSSPQDAQEQRAQAASSRSSPTMAGPVADGGAADLHRQAVSDADLAAEREYGGSGAPRAQTCGRPSHCPAGFCAPYRSQELAEYYRAKNGGWIMAGISAAVNSRVVPLWRDYLNGGSAPRDLTSSFAADFTASPSTARATTFLVGDIRSRLVATRPPVTTTSSVSLASLIPTSLAALNTAGGAHEMNFNVPRDVPGNLAGGIGDNQTACPSGARPSPFNDERIASGSVELTRVSPTAVEARPLINFRVRDTIDLCPGDCGTSLEQIATVPLSQFEATGISGDVPFTVEFPAPSSAALSLSYP